MLWLPPAGSHVLVPPHAIPCGARVTEKVRLVVALDAQAEDRPAGMEDGRPAHQAIAYAKRAGCRFSIKNESSGRAAAARFVRTGTEKHPQHGLDLERQTQ